MVSQLGHDWVLLSYRIPREPSTPRIAVWRKLRDLGVAQVGDGLVALPHDARTKEHLEWVAAEVLEAGGAAIVWIAAPASSRDGDGLATQMGEARSAEFTALQAEVQASDGAGSMRSIRRWRRQWRKIDRRDYFGASGRDEARRAIADHAAALEAPLQKTGVAP